MKPAWSSLMLVVLLSGVGCARARVIPGTTVVDSEENRAIVQTVELYRLRLLEKNVDGLLLLASPKYFEDSGTPQPSDDYNFEGLKAVLRTRLGRVSSLRYDIQYKQVTVRLNEAEVDVFINGAFELATDSDDKYHRVSDHHRFVLERAGEKWKFLSGM